jgi:hypothetical protein
LITAAVGIFAAFNKESVKDKLLLEPGEKVCSFICRHTGDGSVVGT